MTNARYPALALFALAIGGANLAQAGSQAVATNQPVFIPPVLFSGGGGSAASSTAAAGRITPANTQRLTAAIIEVQRFCARLADDLFRIDCLADGLNQWAEAIPETSEYAESRQIVAQASRKLAATARKYRDTSRRPVTARTTDNTRRTQRPIVAVRESARAQATAEAVAVIEEAETLLLRSAEQSQRRRVAFEQISTAIGSSKILLRSA